LTGTRPRSRNATRSQTHRTNAASRPGSARRRRLGWRARLILASSVLILGLFAWGAIARQLAPTSNTSLTRFDAIIVLGAPVDDDGNPTPAQLTRVTEAVHEYERGVAPRLILTGGTDRNHFVEANVMARTAKAQGIPESAIVQEMEATDTIQNGCYSLRIMQRHGWQSAEVVSSASHLPRAGLIFSRLQLEWRTHAAPPLEPQSAVYSSTAAALETLKTVRYLIWARQTDHCGP
jgi:uncharacterized SAM-binding protein YcdF (DUF218 family)